MGIENISELDNLDRRILQILQYDFPVSERPYRDIARKIGSTEEAVLTRVEQLYGKGIIRRLGASINSRQVGYVSTLVALKVDDDHLLDVAKVVNGFPGVTHNYLREGDYNMWFTAIAPDREKLKTILDVVGTAQGVRNLLTLPAKKVFKVNVRFPLTQE